MARSDWRRPLLEPLAQGLRRIKLTVSYDGSSYHGWQKQQNAHSVQEELEKAFERMLGHEIEVVGSGRTDSGVHALGQVCHADISHPLIDASRFPFALNQLLPHDIRVRSCEEVDESFHARFTTMAREYRYVIKEISDFTPFDRNYCYKVKKIPSLDVLNTYAHILKGTHDFTTFTAAADICPSKVRDIYESSFYLEESTWGGKQLVYTICGNAFLYRMVRSLVGTMIQFGSEGMSAQEFQARLEGKNRELAGRTAPACGLFLWRISYDPEEYRWFERGE